MAAPVLQVLVDMNGNGTFVDSGDDVTAALIGDVTWTRGRSADFSGDATGAATFTLDNTAGTYYPSATLLIGRPVLIQSTYSATTRAHFYGYVQRITPAAGLHDSKTVTVTCYDPLGRMAETGVIVPAQSFVSRSARDMRVEVLNEYARGNNNLLANPAFAANTTGWGGTGTLTRITSDQPPGSTVNACGQWVTTTTGQQLNASAYLTPWFLPGQIYTVSAWVKLASGTAAFLFGGSYNAVASLRSFTATGTWTRYSTTYTLPGTTFAAAVAAVVAMLQSTGAGTLLVGDVAITRGEALYPYADTGTGRWASMCGNGSFDGHGLNGWYDGWANLIGNPSFEVDTSGWSNAGDVFVGAGAALSRTTAVHQYGTASGRVAAGGVLSEFYAITGTFKSGVTYDAMIYYNNPTSGAILFGIGSQGTPADKATTAPAGIGGTATVTWTPSADRTDVHLFIHLPSLPAAQPWIDGAQVTRRDASATTAPGYSDTGPGGGGSLVTTRGISATAKYGSSSQSVATPATATSGRVYDFAHLGTYFVAGQAYTLSLWVNPTSSMPYKAGLSASKGDGTWDEATATGTAAANTWTQITVTWTPSADRSALLPWQVVALIYQTDATARTFLVDGVRVIPGSSADAFELPWWSLTAESDLLGTSAALSDTAQGALATLNALTLTRHYIKPSTTTPFFSYVTSSRDDLPAKSSAETLSDNFSGFDSLDIDRASIVNLVQIAYAGGSAWYSDETSVAAYGAAPGGSINGSLFFPDRTIADVVGPAQVARYKAPRARPAMVRVNDDPNTQMPNMIVRELDDLITVTLTRLGITAQHYLIVRINAKVSASGKVWSITYTLEEDPY